MSDPIKVIDEKTEKRKSKRQTKISTRDIREYLSTSGKLTTELMPNEELKKLDE